MRRIERIVSSCCGRSAYAKRGLAAPHFNTYPADTGLFYGYRSTCARCHDVLYSGQVDHLNDYQPAHGQGIVSAYPDGKGETQQALVRTTGVGDNGNRSRCAVTEKTSRQRRRWGFIAHTEAEWLGAGLGPELLSRTSLSEVGAFVPTFAAKTPRVLTSKFVPETG
jgi:hypothetical protein